jgi:Xaa-Pro aminopeptidase
MDRKIIAQRCSRFKRLLSQERLDALLIANYSPSASSLGFDYNLFYLSNLFRRYDNSFLVLTEEDCYLCVDSFEVERARKDSWLELEDAPILGLPVENFSRSVIDVVRKRVSRPNLRLGVNGKRLHGSVALALTQMVEIVDLSLAIEKARLVKDQMEIELITRACQIAEAGAKAVMASIQEGMTEIELAALSQYEMLKQGAEYFWWYPFLAMTGPDAISFNGGGSPSGRRISRGDLVHVDICPSYRGYNADIARTLVMGPPTNEQQVILDITYKAFERAISALAEGNRVGDVLDRFHSVVAGSGFEGCFMGPGHGMGVNDDCYPFFNNENADFVFRNGMYMSIEVGAMVPGIGGVRYEDNFIVNGPIPIRLTQADRVVSIEV